MLSITSEIYFRDLNLIQEKQKNEPKKKMENLFIAHISKPGNEGGG